MLTGSLVAIVTPMHEDGSLDLDAFRSLIDWHVEEKSNGLVVVGTTGESATVDFDEHCLLIREAVERAAGRIPVIAGTGANSTSEAIELSAYAKDAGATMSLSVVPYYNKPTQEGLYRHFKAIAEAVDLPMILYNVPGRTVCDMSNDTAIRLSRVPGIAGIKDATGDLARATDLVAARAIRIRALHGRRCHCAAVPSHGRPRRHLCHRERGPACDARHVCGGVGGQARRSAPDQPSAVSGCTASCSSRRTRSPRNGRSFAWG